MEKIKNFENDKFKLALDSDVNIIVGEEGGKSELLKAIYEVVKVKNNAIYLDVIDFMFNNNESVTVQVQNAILQAAEKYDVVFIDLLCDLLFLTNQHEIIGKCLKINPDVQLFIITNSPAILYDGWELRPINIHNVKK